MPYPTTINNQTISHADGQTISAADDNAQSVDINALSVKVGSGASTPVVGQVLTGTGTGTSGWATPASGFSNPMTTTGDVIVGGASGVAQRLAAGATGLVLTSNGAGVAPTYQASSAAGGMSVFNVTSTPYLATGNTKTISVTMSAGSATCTASAATFTSTAVDAGKLIRVAGAGIAPTDGSTSWRGVRPLLTTISTVTNSTTAVLALAATTAVSGAVCVYGTNDTVAIQAAITAADAVNGLVYLPPGNYMVKSNATTYALQLAANTRFEGAGRDAVIIHGYGNHHVLNGADGMQVRHMTLRGPNYYWLGLGEGDPGAAGINTGGDDTVVEHCLIENMAVQGINGGEDSNRQRFAFNIIRNVWNEGIYWGKGSKNCEILHNDISGCFQNAIDICGYGHRVLGNRIFHNGFRTDGSTGDRCGILSWTVAPITSENGLTIIADNWCEDNQDYGIMVWTDPTADVRRTIVARNVAYANIAGGIMFQGVNGCTSHGNYAVGNLGIAGIIINNDCDDTRSTDDVCLDNTGNGIWVGKLSAGTNPDRTIITNAYCSGNTGQGIRLTDADNTVIHGGNLQGNTSIPFYEEGTGVGTTKVRGPIVGYVTENAGVSTQTPGAVATVNIAHGLAAIPTAYVVQPANAAARDATPKFHVTVTSTNLVLNFSANLTAATSYAWVWRAEIL